MKNISDVLSQFMHTDPDVGLEVTSPIIDGHIHKCRTTYDRKKDRGWYVCHEMPIESGGSIITGAFGYFIGAEKFSYTIELNGIKVSKEEQALIKKRMAESKKEIELAEKSRRDKAAAECESIWNTAEPIGSNDYLTKKSINAYGIRFDAQNTILIPLCDMAGRIHSLQYIYDSQSKFVKCTKRNKDFHSGGGKKGYFHLIGGIPKTVLLVAEGYATAATLHEATNLPVAVTFDAGNIEPVVAAFRKRYWHKIKILICADNDDLTTCMECKGVINITENPSNCPNCSKPHRRVNAGIKCATDTAFVHNAAVVVPEFLDKFARFKAFTDSKTKLTDFNDLSNSYGLHTVRSQIERFIEQKNWNLDSSRPKHEIDAPLKPINTVDEMTERFSLIYGMDKTVWDGYESILITLNGLREITLGRDIFKHWQENPAKKIIRERNLGFDPTGKDKNIIANLFTGFDSEPKQGSCDNLLDLLHHLCGGMTVEGCENYRWMLKWLAYPLQNQGAKMKTAIVVHGGQGVGKNLFFEAIKDIYGKYGGIIGQQELESQYNQWASHKLFLVADEVATQQEKYQVKNKLKAMITGDWINIRPLYMNSYTERNHLNMVFLSNDRVPVILEQDDRRHMVVWVKEKPDAAFFNDIYNEIKNGGVAALHYHLLYNVDCTGFDEHTKPILNDDKRKLVDLCLDNITLFYRDWANAEIKNLPFLPAPSELIYQLYKVWCNKQGVKPASLNRFIDRLEHNCHFEKIRTDVKYGAELSKNPIRCLTHNMMQTSFTENFRTKNKIEMSQAEWLGLCAEKMQQTINAMNEHSYQGG